MQALPPDVLARIVQLAVDSEQLYVGGGRSAQLLPIEVSRDAHGLSGLRLVCRSFLDAVEQIPLYVTVSSKWQARKLARAPFASWRVEAVHLRFSDRLINQQQQTTAPEGMLAAAEAWPPALAQRAVTATVRARDSPCFLNGLRAAIDGGALSSLRHICVVQGLISADMLPASLERLDVEGVVLTELVRKSNQPFAWVCSGTHAAKSVRGEMVSGVVMQDKLASLHALHSVELADVHARIPFATFTQCPTLRVLQLGPHASLSVPGKVQEWPQALLASKLTCIRMMLGATCNMVRPPAALIAAKLLSAC